MHRRQFAKSVNERGQRDNAAAQPAAVELVDAQQVVLPLQVQQQPVL